MGEPEQVTQLDQVLRVLDGDGGAVNDRHAEFGLQLLVEAHGGRAAEDQHLRPVLVDGGPARPDEARTGIGLIGVVVRDAQVDRAHRRQARVKAVPPDGIGHLGDPLAAPDQDREAVPERGGKQHGRLAGGGYHQAARDLPRLLKAQVVEAPDDGRVVPEALELGDAVQDVRHDKGLVVVVFEVAGPDAETDLPQLIAAAHDVGTDVPALSWFHPDGCDVRDAAHDVLLVVPACAASPSLPQPGTLPVMHDDQ